MRSWGLAGPWIVGMNALQALIVLLERPSNQPKLKRNIAAPEPDQEPDKILIRKHPHEHVGS
jgi:hypothetical protein